MPREALPCVVCGAAVENMDDTYANSPYAATAFVTHGHYGSTIFDPMNGSYLELNVCDVCVRRLAGEGKVLLGQDRKRVLCGHMLVGWMPVKRELTPWTPGNEADDDLIVECEQVGDSELLPEIEWQVEAVEYLRSEQAVEEGE